MNIHNKKGIQKQQKIATGPKSEPQVSPPTVQRKQCCLCSQSYSNNPNPFGGPPSSMTLPEREAGRRKRQQGL